MDTLNTCARETGLRWSSVAWLHVAVLYDGRNILNVNRRDVDERRAWCVVKGTAEVARALQ